MTDTASPGSPRLVLRDGDLAMRLLRRGQRLLVENPDGVRRIVQAVMAEGRRFASTPEGSRWKERLGRSELVARGQLIWQAFGLDGLATSDPVVLPSDWVRLVSEALSSVDVEAFLEALLIEGMVREAAELA